MEYLSFSLHVGYRDSLLQVFIQSIHGQEVYISQEHVLCLNVLHGKVTQVVHRIILLQDKKSLVSLTSTQRYKVAFDILFLDIYGAPKPSVLNTSKAFTEVLSRLIRVKVQVCNIQICVIMALYYSRQRG